MKFEGADVGKSEIRITGTCVVDTPNISGEAEVSIDDRIRAVGEFRVVGVRFVVDEKTGEVTRQQLVKPIDIQLCPFDPSDPSDDGILRARP
jgi:hypothetical protein